MMWQAEASVGVARTVGVLGGSRVRAPQAGGRGRLGGRDPDPASEACPEYTKVFFPGQALVGLLGPSALQSRRGQP